VERGQQCFRVLMNSSCIIPKWNNFIIKFSNSPFAIEVVEYAGLKMHLLRIGAGAFKMGVGTYSADAMTRMGGQ